MAPDRLQRAFEVFDAAAAMPRGERDAFLAQECGADAELRADVVSLLAAHDQAEGFLSRRRRSGRSGPAEAIVDVPALAPGTHLGSFRVERIVGAGGMGVVYKARDTRLDRDVAIKVLRDTSGDPRSHARFSFEARAIARLSHPRIGGLHDIAHHDGIDFLVMEFLDGETLAERLRRKPMSPGEALRTALEIAEALSAAHSRGIVHRDLKPANVMLTASGARLLDFGLARLKPGYGPAVDPLVDPSSGHAAPAVIAGTLHYMAPEQLEGKDVDARADIFAFGIVLYEMLTARRPFEGTTTQDLLSAVRAAEPPPIRAPAGLAPVSLDRLVRVCLAADPDERWASIHDVRVQLEWIARDLAQGVAGAAGRQLARRTRLAWIVAAGVLAAALGVLVWTGAQGTTGERRTGVFPVASPPGVVFAAESPPAISADGRRLAFVGTDSAGRQLLYHQALDSHGEARALANTDGALFPFWSPDATRLGFFADGQLKTVHLESGRIQPVAPAGQPRGGTWNRDDVIVFVPRPLDGFYRIPAGGGQPVQLQLNVTGAPGWYPSFLPDGRHLLVYVPSPADPEKARIAVISLDGPTRKDLIPGTRSNAIFAPPGHLLFWSDGTLVAQPFDPATRQVHGSALALPGTAGLNPLTSLALFSVSSSGTLVYFGGAVGQTRMEWVDRVGRPAGPAGPTGLFNSLSLAPDDAKVVYDESAPRSGSVDLRRYDFATGQRTRLTFSPSHDMFPFWARDGSRIFFTSLRTFPPGLFEIDAGSTGNDRAILKKPFPAIPNDVSPDGKVLLYQGVRAGTNGDVFALTLDGRRSDGPVLESPGNEGHAILSPDGRLLAYVSNEGRSYEVYVRQFPVTAGNRQWQISSDGGFEPYWRSDGRELFFLARDRTLMSVPVSGTGATFHPEIARPLFQTTVTWLENQALGRHYAPSRDGQRFLIANATDRARAMPVTVVLDWAASLPGDPAR
jgi:predicted Ser/Thr protein kinase